MYTQQISQAPAIIIIITTIIIISTQVLPFFFLFFFPSSTSPCVEVRYFTYETLCNSLIITPEKCVVHPHGILEERCGALIPLFFFLSLPHHNNISPNTSTPYSVHPPREKLRRQAPSRLRILPFTLKRGKQTAGSVFRNFNHLGVTFQNPVNRSRIKVTHFEAPCSFP